MAVNKSPLNKTIDFSVEEGRAYLERCLYFCPPENASWAPEDVSCGPDTSRARHTPLTPESIKNKTIRGDTFAVLPELPKAFADLAIVDPPYNLSKNYAGNKFAAQNMQSYAEYTRAWLNLLLPRLKKTATLYICCDWKSSVSIADVLFEFERERRLYVQNRITWQREKGRGAKANWKNGMEDIWYCTLCPEAAVSPENVCGASENARAHEGYTFNLEQVKIRRKVIAPYKENGKPKDWNETTDGNFRDTCPSNFWDDISIPFWSMAENTATSTAQ